MHLTKRSAKYLSLDNIHKQIWPSDLKPAGRRNPSKTSLDLYYVRNHEHSWLFRWSLLGLETSLALSVSQQGGRSPAATREARGNREERRLTERQRGEKKEWEEKNGEHMKREERTKTGLVVQITQSATQTTVISLVATLFSPVRAVDKNGYSAVQFNDNALKFI